MLADASMRTRAGELHPEVHFPGTARHELLGFIADQLPRWRDRPERKPVTSERALTAQLCGHLSSAARLSDGWSWVVFQIEGLDEVHPQRAIDLAPMPCGVVAVIEGRRHTDSDALLPIECKRLPTPKDRRRDEREYVITQPGTTGGIQRFKFGYHGTAHRVAAMIGYVQEEDFDHWLVQINGWIQALAEEIGSAWCDSDVLQQESEDAARGLCSLRSHHQRQGACGECELVHFWVRMN